MKIGIDCRLWGETGVGRYIRNLVSELSKIDTKNDYVVFALGKDKGEILKKVQHDKFKIIVADVEWHSFEEQMVLPQILNKENLDLMHFPYFSVPIFYNRPFVVTIHDLIINHFPTGQASTLSLPIYKLKLLAYKFVLNKSAKKANKIIAVSNATKSEIIDHLGVNPQKVIVTYEGVDEKITNFPPSLKLPPSQVLRRTRRRASKIQNYFLYVGNAYPHKNLVRLLEAFKILDQDVKLVLVGKDDYFYKRLNDKVRKMGLAKNVNFLQNVSDEDLSSLYLNAKALILPSLMEGFGLSALEAMANNCLVLASDIPSLREVCSDAAIYFNPHDVKDMAEKMKEVEFNKNNGKKEKGLERVKFFSWGKMAKETLKIYESCVSL